MPPDRSTMAMSPGTRERVPLLLLPGTLCDARVFDAVRSAVTGREVLASGLPVAGTTAAMAAAVLAHAPRRFAVAGLSLGGIVALEIALAAPRRVAGLALIGANARPAANDRATGLAEARRVATDLDAHARDTLAPLYAGQRDVALAPLVADMARAIGPTAFLAQAQAALTRPDRRSRLAEIDVPTLILAGEADRLGTPDKQRELAAGIARAVLRLLPGIGHLAPVEDPDAVGTALVSWLAQVDQDEVADAAWERERA